MPPLSTQDVAEIALLARLHLEPEEAEQMRLELGAILEHFTQLTAVDTDGVAPMTHAMSTELRLRLDVVEPSLTVAEALAAAPKRDGDLIVVPAILPGNEP
ncbi:MAG: Asp-tRNA(Asn)/Glu-tRNA(Gln) amidotransferase subunit GatC [Proteobacteria bacterium]|nr:Asp-tRNA(Asn)/Glu-tRNA(Gln) amidotransferase subunit GatC [Pseudomonadota bacterium]